MKAIVMHETGRPEVLGLEDVPDPQPGEGEVLVRVHAAAINPIEYKQRRGSSPKKLPAILGSDISGVVELSRAERFATGDEVFGFAAGGAYAQLARARAEVLALKPAGVSHETAAGLPVAGLTAWQALFDRGDLRAGQSVLVAGGAGGVGHLAVQFAAHADARVTATGSARNREFVLGLGAQRYVDYASEDPVAAVGEGVDLVFDTVGGEGTPALVGAVRAGGVIVTIASAAPEEQARARGVRAVLLIASPSAEQLARIAELVAAGEVRVEIAQTFALEQAPRAHELSESGHTRGKLVLSLLP
jgi:NADPH:quinone reductase-like Zn-dependent oxidoreductase